MLLRNWKFFRISAKANKKYYETCVKCHKNHSWCIGFQALINKRQSIISADSSVFPSSSSSPRHAKTFTIILAALVCFWRDSRASTLFKFNLTFLDSYFVSFVLKHGACGGGGRRAFPNYCYVYFWMASKHFLFIAANMQSVMKISMKHHMRSLPKIE